MELAQQTAVVAQIRQVAGNQLAVLRGVDGAIDIGIDRRGITAAQKACAAGGTNGILAICPGKGNALRAQLIQIGCVNIGIAQRMDGIPALLVRCQPENIGAFCHGQFLRL